MEVKKKSGRVTESEGGEDKRKWGPLMGKGVGEDISMEDKLGGEGRSRLVVIKIAATENKKKAKG